MTNGTYVKTRNGHLGYVDGQDAVDPAKYVWVWLTDVRRSSLHRIEYLTVIDQTTHDILSLMQLTTEDTHQ